jgi:hypothetical protein
MKGVSDMIYITNLSLNINCPHDRRFFSNKKDAISYGKMVSKRDSWTDWEMSQEVTYEVEACKTPKTKKQWIEFLNHYGSIGGE